MSTCAASLGARYGAVVIGAVTASMVAAGCSRPQVPPPARVIVVEYERSIFLENHSGEPTEVARNDVRVWGARDDLLKQSSNTAVGDTAMKVRFVSLDRDKAAWQLVEQGGAEYRIELRPGESEEIRFEGTPYTIRFKLKQIMEAPPGSVSPISGTREG